MSKLTVVGSINADLIIRAERHPLPGETLVGIGGEILAGGKGANQAVAAAQLGAHVAFVGAVGRDAYAVPAMAYMETSGIDVSAVATADTNTGLAVITVAADGENTIVISPGANALVDDAFVTARASTIADADIVLLQGEIPSSGFAAAVAATTGRVIINLAPVVEVNPAALLRADPLLANEHEAGLILAQLGQKVDAAASPRELAKGLLGAGFRSVVLTLGSAGALVATADAVTEIPTPRIEAVDTTGAGDAFAGALCVRLLEGENLEDAARFAARVGAFAATGAGAQPSYPTTTSALPEV
ncbi:MULTISPECIES: ribokinase [Corynebacterium]|uniref:ribokinase n=1 Tax=Corynebacterium TaxID=1716 RepID=UPI000ECA9A36|nr:MULTISPECIES: ribokinase [Corynebacterium]MDN6226448.1 ribokinase [Corynebacterium flavescens]HCG46434.1 ribokinase [Corynebacterium flavescens]